MAEDLAKALDQAAIQARVLRDTLDTIDDHLRLNKDREPWISGLRPFQAKFLDAMMDRWSVTADQLVLILWGARPEHRQPHSITVRLSQATRAIRAGLERECPGLSKEFIVEHGSKFGPAVYRISAKGKEIIRGLHHQEHIGRQSDAA